MIVLKISSAWASVSQFSCHTYFANDAEIPSEAREIINSMPNVAVEKCVDRQRPEYKKYAVLSRPKKGVLGICQYTERHIFQIENGSNLVWEVAAPNQSSDRTFMAHSTNECPQQEASEYVLTTGVTEEAFLATTQYWSDILDSKKGRLYKGNNTRLEKQSESFKKFEAAVKKVRAGKPALTLLQIWKSASNVGGEYTLAVSGSMGSWDLTVAIRDGTVSLLGISTAYY